jgi:hypothetical protein
MVAGPGVSPEWSQGGESEWNSMGAPAEEIKAECRRDLAIPRAGKYRVWVRYVDHRGKTEPFSLRLEQGGKAAIAGELGIQPVVPPNDEYELYWGFSFGWGSLEGDLKEGPAKIRVTIEKAGDAFRQVDAILVSDDLQYVPNGREKPSFACTRAMNVRPADEAVFRGTARDFKTGASWNRPKVGGRDFSMWEFFSDDTWLKAQKEVEKVSLYDAYFNMGPLGDVICAQPWKDIRESFVKQFAGRKDLPVISWPNLLPGFYLNNSPDLSPGAPLRKWLESTKAPFFIITNGSQSKNTAYTDQSGPATYQALTGPLANQFMGYIHGEAVGPWTMGLWFNFERPGEKLTAKSRREYIDTLGRKLVKMDAEDWSKYYKTPVAESHRSKAIPCVSCHSLSLVHLFHEIGEDINGYEVDATMGNVPMRLAFQRGAARQYGKAWINYASSNFGDACNYFAQRPMGGNFRGADAWYVSKYSITDGVSATWYRKLYYLNYLSGSSAVFWEQGLWNQWIKPGPGDHPVQLSPFGRATEEFQAFVDRVPDRGEPYTPVAFLLSYGHGYDRLDMACKMLGVFPEDWNDIELRELFNVCWHPAAVAEGLPAIPGVQSFPNGVYGNIFDVLVDRPERVKAIMDYPVVWAAGDVELGDKALPVIEDYVKKGGTLVVNVEAARGKLPDNLLGVKLAGKKETVEGWLTGEGESQPSTPYEVEKVAVAGAQPLAWAAKDVPLITRHKVGEGAVILTLVPRMLGRDERAHPSLPYLVNGITHGLVPVEVRSANGERLSGEIMHQVNRTKDGWLVGLFNSRGVDKTQNGIARVDRQAFVDVLIRCPAGLKSAREHTQPRDLAVEKKDGAGEVRLRVHPGDVQVVGLVAK